MNDRQTYKTDLVKSILEEFPNASTRSLASILFERYPLDFINLEQARGHIRYYRGEHENSK